MDTYLVIAGEERTPIEAGKTVNDILSEQGVERGEGEILLVADKEVTGTDVVPEGASLIYVPAVDLGF